MRIPLPSVGAELCSSLPDLSVLWDLVKPLERLQLLSGVLWPDPMPACLEALLLLLPGLVAAAAAAQAVCCSVLGDGCPLGVMALYSSHRRNASSSLMVSAGLKSCKRPE